MRAGRAAAPGGRRSDRTGRRPVGRGVRSADLGCVARPWRGVLLVRQDPAQSDTRQIAASMPVGDGGDAPGRGSSVAPPWRADLPPGSNAGRWRNVGFALRAAACALAASQLSAVEIRTASATAWLAASALLTPRKCVIFPSAWQYFPRFCGLRSPNQATSGRTLFGTAHAWLLGVPYIAILKGYASCLN
jgi:hypothetical protein